MKIGAKQRKLFIIGFGVVAVVALSYILVAQRLDVGGTSENLESKKETLLKYLETIDLESTYEVDLYQYQARLQENRKRFLEGENSNIAESELLKVLTDFAEKNGVEITQKNVQKAQTIEDKLYKVSARIRTQCTSDALVQFLTDIRNYNKFLTIEELTIQIRRTRTRPTGDMQPSFTVSGYIDIPENEGVQSGPSVG